MRVNVEPTYEMSKVLGLDSFEVEGVETVADVIAKAQEKIGPEFERLVRVAAISVNGVVVSHGRGMKTRLADGDRVGFVKAAAGG